MTPMAPPRKTFRPCDLHQRLLLPSDLAEWVLAGYLARLVSELVANVLDLSAIYAAYTEQRGAPPYHPRLLRICCCTDRRPGSTACGGGSRQPGS